ncbi:MAG: biotin/lipoate A/B protein ligase family protein, partial [Nitrospinales bacterium]
MSQKNISAAYLEERPVAEKKSALQWRFIDEGLCDGRYNMATDQALLTACNEGESPPTLRLYGWIKPTLTLGYSQDPDKEVDLERCRALDISVVRRPTGGRSVLHYREITYSIIAPVNHPRFPPDLAGTYRVISLALLRGLKNLGISNGILVDEKKITRKRSPTRSPACFASTSRCEITVNGKKLIGNAQRRMSRAFLQHGSILIENDRPLQNALFHFENENLRKKSLDLLIQSSTTLNEVR